MPGWLSNLKGAASNLADSIVDEVSELIPDNVDLGPVLENLRSTASECNQAARETVEVCETTKEKRQAMIAFGEEISETFQSLKEADDASAVLDTIKDLTDGDKVRAAKELAEGVDEAALSCVEKSIRMIDLMENSVDSLPEFVQRAIEGDDPNEDADATDLLQGLDRDIQDIQTCVSEIKELNLVTALKIGRKAFQQLTDKAQRTRSLFDRVQTFATDVDDVTRAFSDMDVASVASKSKDMVRCIRMTKTIRAVAEGAEKLIRAVIGLFEMTAVQVSALWSALAFAKDCMSDSLTQVTEARQLCLKARNQSTTLLEKSLAVKEQLDAIGDVNAKSISALRELSGGNEIRDAITLAQQIDDEVLICVDKAKTTISRVTEGVSNLPDMLTDSIDIGEEGREGDDPDPAMVEKDIEDLKASTVAVEEANILEAVRSGASGFSGVAGKTELCRELLDQIQQFAVSSERTIGSFMSSWDLESASTKVTEMCRLVNVGEMIKQYAEQVQRLVVAVIAFIKAAAAKFSSALDGLGDGVLQDAMEHGEEFVENAMEKMKDKLNFFG